MQSPRRHPTLFVDLIGAALLIVVSSLMLSMTVLAGDEIVVEIAELERSITESKRSLALIRGKVDGSRAQLERNRAQLADRGRLPDEPPIDEYFRFLSSLATRHDLSVLNQYPLGERGYPGLRETRFAYEVTGSLADLVRFFRAIEDAPYWADIGYLKIHPPPMKPDARSAQLTVCLFSAAEPERENESDQG